MMTNGELNQFILHYLTKDKTHSAIMLTGSWGTGKSYYIQNVLVPFLKEDHKKECVTVSLYGLKSISEVSKNIYLELRAKALSAKGEAAIAGKLIAKTIAKGVVGRLGIDLSVDSSTMQKLYESVDLSNRLVILEDVERSQIGILELLGYVNSLVEQDGVKVLLVANEEEILKNHYCEETELSAFEQGWIDDEQKPRSAKRMSEDAQKYLSVKEKTVSDTVQFTGEYTSAILQIIDSFDNSMLKKFANDASARTILNLMDIYKHHNLRSLIFACQKSVDIMESLDAPYGEDFVESIFFGIICFTFRFKAGKNLKWDENEHYSIELGSESFPLFKFCFDYITRQYIDVTTIAATAAAFDKKKLYDRRKTIGDSDLQTLCTYHAHYESEVLQAVESIDRRLDDQNDISFYDYGAIAGHFNVTDLKVSLWDNKTPKIYGAPGIVRCQVNSEKIENIKFQEVPYSRFQIDWLGTRVGQLFELIGCADSRPYLGFLPKTNADINVDSYKIRDICTAFEVEYGFRACEFESSDTKELVVRLKETIKRYRDDHPKQLSEDVYNSAYNSLSFISLPAREKVWRIYSQFKEVIDSGFKEMSRFSGTILNLTEAQTRTDIQWLVQLRNNITHAPKTTEQDIPNAIYSRLRIAIYCSTLVRAGYPIEEIAAIIKAYFSGRVE